MDTPLKNEAVARLIAFAGSQEKAATLVGVTQSVISKWLAGLTRVSPERARAIETLTGGEVTRAGLRPDLWG